MSDELSVKTNVVVSLAYRLTVDGVSADHAPAEAPLVYLQGRGNLIVGLERELEGMKAGESKSVLISPDDGYGEYDPEAVIQLERSLFGDSYPLSIGGTVHLQDEANHHFEARVVAIDEAAVTVDLNHPMAGKELLFDVEIVDLREATADEPAGGCGGCSCHGGCSGCE